jgi:hypothetical protein
VAAAAVYAGNVTDIQNQTIMGKTATKTLHGILVRYLNGN